MGPIIPSFDRRSTGLKSIYICENRCTGYNQPMKTSRQRLLEYVQAHRVVTVEDLSRALRMTRANARHHLAILKEQGVVDLVGLQSSQGKGRPAQLYSLSAQTQRHNLDHLVSALLQELVSSKPVDKQYSTFRNLAQRMLADSLPESGLQGAPPRPTPNLTQRLYTAVRQLNEFNYQARWEAHAIAPRLIFEHCPYAAILPKHPEMCRFDGVLLEEMLGSTVTQTAKLEPDPRGAVHCIFHVGK